MHDRRLRRVAFGLRRSWASAPVGMAESSRLLLARRPGLQEPSEEELSGRRRRIAAACAGGGGGGQLLLAPLLLPGTDGSRAADGVQGSVGAGSQAGQRRESGRASPPRGARMLGDRAYILTVFRSWFSLLLSMCLVGSAGLAPVGPPAADVLTGGRRPDGERPAPVGQPRAADVPTGGRRPDGSRSGSSGAAGRRRAHGGQAAG